MLSKSSFFTTILLLLPALVSAQTADDDLQLELRYYAPKLKFTSLELCLLLTVISAIRSTLKTVMHPNTG